MDENKNDLEEPSFVEHKLLAALQGCDLVIGIETHGKDHTGGDVHQNVVCKEKGGDLLGIQGT